VARDSCVAVDNLLFSIIGLVATVVFSQMAVFCGSQPSFCFTCKLGIVMSVFHGRAVHFCVVINHSVVWKVIYIAIWLFDPIGYFCHMAILLSCWL